MNLTGWLVVGGLVAVCLLMVSAYNGMVALRNRFKNAFSQIDVQLKRRYDLITPLVSTVKGYLKHERETLEAVIAARNNAGQALESAHRNPTDAAGLKSLARADGELTGAMGKLFALAESYPDLKADEVMTRLMEELTSTENKVAFARQAYNDSVAAYNTAIESFPQSLMAGIGSFTPAALWEIEAPAERSPVKVEF
jgi:LemA protein